MSFNIKEAKKAARKNLKTDYVVFVIACLLAAYLGSAYSSTLVATQSRKVTSVVENVSETDKGLSMDSVLSDLLTGNLTQSESRSKIIVEDAVKNEFKVGGLEFGRVKGALSSFVNGLQSGKFLILVFQTILTITNSNSITTAIFVGLTALVVAFFMIFVKNTFKVSFRRIFLEGHTYDHVKISRFLFLFRVKRYIKATLTILLVDIYQLLWNLTIIGGIIKKYSYAMVPYIVAENPDIDAKKAIQLSNTMMFGHKWELFVTELSFIGWHILGFFTLGLTQILFSNPYQECTTVSFYVYVRDLAKQNKITYYQLMNDPYLFEKADIKLINKTYADILKIMNDDIVVEDYLHSGFRGFVENNLGVIYKYDKDEDMFNVAIEQEERIEENIYILTLEQYPGRLFPIPENKRDPRLEHVHYLRHYSIWSIIAMFFIFCFVGWSWEVAIHLVKDGLFVNRGTMHGPWLPIYGFGCTFILLILYKFRNRMGLEAALTVVLCGVLEYSAHWALELLKGTKWWDYSGYYLNINGRICAEGLLVFMLGGLAVVYALGPIIDNGLRKVNKTVLKTICIILLVIFACDFVYSCKYPNMGAGITDYGDSSYNTIERVDKC